MSNDLEEIQNICAAMVATCYKCQFDNIREEIDQWTDHLTIVMDDNKIPYERKEIRDCLIDSVARALKFEGNNK
jgi:hypothetical protein